MSGSGSGSLPHLPTPPQFIDFFKTSEKKKKNVTMAIYVYRKKKKKTLFDPAKTALRSETSKKRPSTIPLHCTLANSIDKSLTIINCKAKPRLSINS